MLTLELHLRSGKHDLTSINLLTDCNHLTEFHSHLPPEYNPCFLNFKNVLSPVQSNVKVFPIVSYSLVIPPNHLSHSLRINCVQIYTSIIQSLLLLNKNISNALQASAAVTLSFSALACKVAS